MPPPRSPRIRRVTPRLLARWPLPSAEGGDKDTRGCILIIGGSKQMAGAPSLSALASLRVGAGKLQIAVPETVSVQVSAQVLESFVIALPELASGGIKPAAASGLEERIGGARAVVFGPGMVDDDATASLLQRLSKKLGETTLVLDAAALKPLGKDPKLLHPLQGKALLTPHSGEMASITGLSKREVEDSAGVIAVEQAKKLKAVVVLKGARTYIAGPAGELFCNDSAGNAGLGTSGSGDVLAGILGGLLARGASELQAAVWGVYLHARAGDRLARRVGKLGYLARELLDELPGVMEQLSGGGRRHKAR